MLGGTYEDDLKTFCSTVSIVSTCV